MMMSLPRLYMRFVEIIGIPVLGFVAMGGLHFVTMFGAGWLEGRPASETPRNAARPVVVPGYPLQPGGAGHPIVIAARDLAAEPRGNNLLARVGEVRLALPEGSSGVEYRGISLFVYQGSKVVGTIRDQEQRGFLHRQAPEISIYDWTVKVPNAAPACLRQKCRARLVVTAVQAGRATSHVNSGFAALPVSRAQTLTESEPAPSRYWDTYYRKALEEKLARRHRQARQQFEEALAFIATNHEEPHPASARIEYDLAQIAKSEGRKDEFRRRMQSAYEILDPMADAEVARVLSEARTRLDKEMVARGLAGHLWDARDYAGSYRWYRLAYDAVADLETSDYSRNLKLARNASGIMATSCMLGHEAESKEALAELKRRYEDLEKGAQKSLDYWVKSGQRFINKGRCQR